MSEILNPLEMLEAAQALHERRGSPYSLAIEFAWPLADEDWAEWRPDFDPADIQAVMHKHAQELGAPLVELVAPTLAEGETAEVRSVGIGRGASVEGIALIVFTVGVGVAGVMATLDGAISFFLRVREWYRKLSGASLLSGRQLDRPSLSLGAAIALAGADLYDRERHVEGIHIISALIHPAPELDHSASDLFVIIFGDNDQTWVYLVDSVGRVLLFSQGLPLPSWGQFYLGVGGGVEDDSYPTLGEVLQPDEEE